MPWCPARAQEVVGLRNGTLTGVVIDAVTKAPVPLALITLGEIRQFASAQGRFLLRGVREGRADLTVAQIGYGPRTLPAQFRNDSSGPGTAELTVMLTRVALVLPELTVVASPACGQGVAGSSDLSLGPAIAAVLENARRLLALEQAYPFESVFLFLSQQFDSADQLLSTRRGTSMASTKRMRGYQPGRVLERSGTVNYFTTSDLARPLFLQSHCLWPAGVDTIEGAPAVVIGFAPVSTIVSPDWSGRLVVDLATSRLLRSEASLDHLDSTRTKLRAVNCQVRYGEVAPLVLHEAGAQCTLVDGSKRRTWTLETLRPVSIRFLGKKPGDS